MKNHSLFFFTNSFPYGNGESFVKNEIPYLAKSFKFVYIFPLFTDSAIVRKLPDNCEVINISQKISKAHFLLILQNLPQYLNMLIIEIRGRGLKVFKNMNRYFNQFGYLLLLANKLRPEISKRTKSGDVFYFYSYWMNEWSHVLSILKYNKIISSFICRTHGYDLYDDRSRNKYIAYKFFVHFYCNAIISASEQGYRYLVSQLRSSEKLSWHHLAISIPEAKIPSYQFAPPIHILSVSNMVSVKNIERIIHILALVKQSFLWTHIGDGNDRQKLFSQATKKLESNSWSFLGQYEHSEVIQYYQNNRVDIFISMSLSEAVPVTMMEANSFGVPILATKAGGIEEIVKPINGYLLDPATSNHKIADLIDHFPSSKFSKTQTREEIRSYIFNHFDANKQYPEFLRKYLVKD